MQLRGNVRNLLTAKAGDDSDAVKLIAKIESPHCFLRQENRRFVQGGYVFENYIPILDDPNCWAIMVARGDLGAEIAPKTLPYVQRKLTEYANAAGTAVVVATQMMLSMLSQPVPSRADVTDIHDAVLEGADVVMLSEETAVGDFPVESLKYMREIVDEAVQALLNPPDSANYQNRIWAGEEELIAIRDRRQVQTSPEIMDVVGEPIVNLARRAGSPIIICYALTGRTAMSIPKFRPEPPIVAIASSGYTARNLLFYFGTFPMWVVKRTRQGNIEPDFDFPRELHEYRDFISGIVQRSSANARFAFRQVDEIPDGMTLVGSLAVDRKGSRRSDRSIVVFDFKEAVS